MPRRHQPHERIIANAVRFQSHKLAALPKRSVKPRGTDWNSKSHIVTVVIEDIDEVVRISPEAREDVDSLIAEMTGTKDTWRKPNRNAHFSSAARFVLRLACPHRLAYIHLHAKSMSQRSPIYRSIRALCGW